jgi:hypothetical protein
MVTSIFIAGYEDSARLNGLLLIIREDILEMAFLDDYIDLSDVIPSKLDKLKMR